MSEAEPQQETDQYARIVTNHEEMENLLKLVRLRGKGADGTTSSLIKDTILHFEDGSVTVKAFDPMASVWLHVRGPFKGVRREGRLVIGDISSFLSYLERFGEHTAIEIAEQEDGYYLTFDDEERKSGGYTAAEEMHIKSVQDVEELPYVFDADLGHPTVPGKPIDLDTWFRCDVQDIQDILEDGDTTEVRKYPITVDGGSIRVRVGDEDGWIDTNFTASAGEGTAASIYGYGMDNVFSNLDGDIRVFLIEDGAMWVHQEPDDGYDKDYMIAEDETT